MNREEREEDRLKRFFLMIFISISFSFNWISDCYVLQWNTLRDSIA